MSERDPPPGDSKKVLSTRRTLEEIKRLSKARLQSASTTVQEVLLPNEYEEAENCLTRTRKKTGIVYSKAFMKHECSECESCGEQPLRYSVVMEKLESLGLLSIVETLQLERFDVRYVKAVHSEEHVNNLMCAKESACYNRVYFDKDTFNVATTAVDATLTIVKAVYDNKIQNGMALIRPPGHLAKTNEFMGHCYFNNVAIAARYILKEFKVKKVLIIDLDVHPGLGTQEAFYNTNEVLYISLHRYDCGTHWPHDKTASYSHIGESAGKGYNINVAFNDNDLEDIDYITVVNQIILPVAYEYQPEFILISAGYNKSITPAFYGHFIKLISGLANGKIAVVLENGSNMLSLLKGVVITLQGLLDYTTPLLAPSNKLKADTIRIINCLFHVLNEYWTCFKIIDRLPQQLEDEYKGIPLKSPFLHDDIPRLIDNSRDFNMTLNKPTSVCYVYDTDMLKHCKSDTAYENLNRLKNTYDRFLQLVLQTRVIRAAIIDDIDPVFYAKKVHDSKYIDTLFSDDYFLDLADKYWKNPESRLAVEKAISCSVTLAKKIITGKYSSGVAFVRPPGHHADIASSSGFCFVNNVAISAKCLIDDHNVKRILIVDFDIHHGNGTQSIFYNTDKVLFVSIHKFEKGLYFPKSQDGSHLKIGEGAGMGYNINIPFSNEKLLDQDYLYVFFKVILPVAYSYSPEIILVSAGFDGGINDPLGTYKILPETFGHFIQLLKPLAQGRIALFMEGGYNLATLSHSLNFCVKTLLGDPLPMLNNSVPVKKATYNAIKQVVDIQKQYWPVLEI